MIDSSAHPAVTPAPGIAARVRLPQLGAEQRAAVRDVLTAFSTSRLLIWLVGIGAALALGFHPLKEARFDPLHLTTPFRHRFPNLLLSPAARWDSSWYLGIAEHGYGLHGPHLQGATAFFPLYPALIAAAAAVAGPPILAGLVICGAASVGALYLLHRLVTLELGAATARTTVWLAAWLPPAIFLSAVYSEGLFLLLSVASFYAARSGRWALAGAAAALAAATRSEGLLLIVPLAILYLYGPRADREPERPAAGLRPRYRPRWEGAWIGLAPLGPLAYMAYLGAVKGKPLDAFTAQADWHRQLAPLAGIPLGAWKGLVWLHSLAVSVPSLDLRQIPVEQAGRAIVELAFLGLALWLLRECWRRLPAAYTAYAVAGLALPLSAPAAPEPLRSMPRLTLVLFPLWIALALWARERGKVREALIVCAPLLAAWTVLFTSWIWAP